MNDFGFENEHTPDIERHLSPLDSEALQAKIDGYKAMLQYHYQSGNAFGIVNFRCILNDQTTAMVYNDTVNKVIKLLDDFDEIKDPELKELKMSNFFINSVSKDKNY